MAAVIIKFKKFERSVAKAILEEISRAGELVGSWWLTVGILIIIGWILYLGLPVITEFYCILTLSVVISMVITSPIATALGRYINDQVYRSNYHQIVEALTGASTITIVLNFIVSFILIFLFSKIFFNLKVLFCALTVSLSILWLSSNTMSVLEKERIALLGYGIGALIALFFYFLFWAFCDKTKFYLSFLIIDFIIFSCITSIIHYTYIYRGLSSGPVFPYFNFFSKKYFFETLASFFITLGIWIDKIVFWFHPSTAHKIDPILRYSFYDYPFFIAFTCASFAQFLIFRNYKKLREIYKNYTDALRYNYSFSYLYLAKMAFIQEWRQSIYRLIYIYGSFILIILFLIISGKIVLPWKNPFIFHYFLIGTLFFILFLFNSVILEYFQKFGCFFICSVLFCLLNFILSLLSINKDKIFWGTGFLGSAIIAGIFSLILVSRLLSRIEYESFKKVAIQF